MSTQALASSRPISPSQEKSSQERFHRTLVFTGYLVAIVLLGALAVYGWDYYTLAYAERPLSPKYALLKPSGRIGLALGYIGLFMFFSIFLYAVRRRWQWLANIGNSKHWLDFHVLMGVMAPFVIAFHSSFKFSGFAGTAFWIMVCVALSGVIGRYVYSQIPRSLNATEYSISELEDLHQNLSASLARQNLLPADDLKSLLRLPDSEAVGRMFIPIALSYMVWLDLVRVFRVARLRRHAIPASERLDCLGGLLKTEHPEVERAIEAAREQSKLNKRMLFLSRAHSIFELWHVVHRPFSYSFAVLAVLHIVVVTLLGFVR